MKILEQLFRAPYVNSESGIDISPDGKKIAFSWNIIGSWEIYEALLDGTGKLDCKTTGPGGKFSPQYSPDGLRMAYALDINGSESFHIYLVDLIHQSQKDLTPTITFPIHPHFYWSPNGDEIAYLSIEPEEYGVYLLSVKNNSTRQICIFDQPLRDVSRSPDGTYLAIEEETAGSDSSLILVFNES